VRLERLRQALARASALRAQAPASAEVLLAQVHGQPQRIALADITHLTADTKYVAIHHAGGEALCDLSLKAIDEAFPGRFVRIHRACLVPAGRLLGLTREADGSLHALIAGTAATPEVSRRNLAAVRAALRG
jgi:two-component system response regulator AlgR